MNYVDGERDDVSTFTFHRYVDKVQRSAEMAIAFSAHDNSSGKSLIRSFCFASATGCNDLSRR